MAQPPDPAELDLDASVALAVKRAQAAVRAAMEEVLRPLGTTVAQYACLAQLERRPHTAAELARTTFVTRQSSAVLLRGLADAGLVADAPGPVRGRALPVVLTPAGRALLTDASAAVARVEGRMVAGLAPDRRRALLADLDACVRALAEPAG
ncbi:MarR family transcriptional regulator [Rhodococcus aerolatus]